MDQRGANTSHAGSRQRLGSHVARLLRGSWRDAGLPPADAGGSDLFDFSEAELTEITPLLSHLGAGALAWRQLRDSALASCPAAHKLREIYRRHRLSALLHEREIAQVLTLLSAAGIEPVLIKGWAIARRYPDYALRPYGDVDLCVRPDQYDQATRMLRRIASIEGPFVDLHSGFTGVGQTKVQGPKSKVQSLSAVRRLWTEDGDDWDELYERSQLVHVGLSVPVRVLSDEDHLRILCRHLLRSGAHRPPWLCDVALLIEQAQSPVTTDDRGQTTADTLSGSSLVSHRSSVDGHRSSFRWDICLGRDARDANWIGTVVGLAHELLGANIDDTPFANQQLPAWLVPAVLDQWGGKRVQSPKSKVQSLLTADRPWTLDLGPWTNLYHRWDNPIRATAAVGGRFDDRSRIPYRLLESAMRISGQ